jgi:neutral trehalase
MIQPPALAHAVEALFKATGDRESLKADLRKSLSYYRWISRERDPDNTGLFRIISPYECGLDNSPVFDKPLGLSSPGRNALLWKNRKLDFMNLVRGNYDYSKRRAKKGFSVADPLMNAIFADGLRTIERLSTELGESAQASEAAALALRTEEAIERMLWDEEAGAYLYLSGEDDEKLTTLTAGSIMPLILGSIRRERLERIINEHLLNEDEFWTPLPIPSSPRSDPAYDPIGESSIWRGPVCMNLNWLFIRGLRAHGYDAVAADIADRSQRAAFRDFREFYSPETGAGMRGTEFGWATAAVDM